MSSWDRSRNIPWSHVIPVAPAGENEDVDLKKERVLRELRREAAIERTELESSGGGDASDGGTTATQPRSSAAPSQEKLNVLGFVGRPYQTSDLLRNVAFGATIGSITGACFGFMDSIRAASDSALLKSASRSAQGKFVFQGTYRSGMFFGAFFGAYHTLKYGTRVLVDPGDVGEIGVGGVVAFGGLMAKREWRASMPYAVMLVAMDGFHIMMNEVRN